MNSKKLTIRQEKFALAFFKTGNATEAYRQAYDCTNKNKNSVNRIAFDLSHNVKILSRVRELQEELKKQTDITVDKKRKALWNIVEYGLEEICNHHDEEAQPEIRQRNPSAAVAAIKELNAMDGDHAALKMKLDVSGKIEVSARDIALEHSLSYDEIEQAIQLTRQGMSEEEAVKKIVHDRDVIDA